MEQRRLKIKKKMKVLYSISITCVIILGVIACTDKHEANYNIPKVEPGLYTIELGLNTKTEANTRGFDEGGFDGVYENNIIYIGMCSIMQMVEKIVE